MIYNAPWSPSQPRALVAERLAAASAGSESPAASRVRHAPPGLAKRSPMCRDLDWSSLSVVGFSFVLETWTYSY